MSTLVIARQGLERSQKSLCGQVLGYGGAANAAIQVMVYLPEVAIIERGKLRRIALGG